MGEVEKFSGGCLCGAVRFHVTPPARWCFHCHCTLCRKAHGAAFVTWFGADKTQVRIDQGEDVLRWRASSDHGRRAFCSECGTQIFFETSKYPQQIDVVRACVDGSIDRAPSAHVFVSTRVDWVAIDDGLPRHVGDSSSARADL